MTTWSSTYLEGWGRTHRARVPAVTPTSGEQVEAAIRTPAAPSVIAYGAGRSYADTAINSSGSAMIMSRLNDVVSFDDGTGELVCEPGITFQDLIDRFLPRRFMVPVTPGTAFATIGGAIANDVHGKNHDGVGSFGDHVNWIELLLPDGDVRRVSPTQDRQLFEATIGGVGLTGIMLSLSFNMVAVPSNAVDVKEQRIPDLETFFAEFSAIRDKAPYTVGWIDGVASGPQLGRGLLMSAGPADEDVKHRSPDWLSVPVDLPNWTLNPWTISAFNHLYYRRIPAQGRESRSHVVPFHYPLDAIRRWNRIYGRRGFYQFQCVLPDETSFVGMRKLMEEIAAARSSSFLSVIKTLGGEGRGCLSFPVRGYTLALDFARKPGIEDLLARLECITLDHGGRIYLAKDGCLSAEGFARMYPRLPELREILGEIDPNRMMDSDLARRLDIRGDNSGNPDARLH